MEGYPIKLGGRTFCMRLPSSKAYIDELQTKITSLRKTPLDKIRDKLDGLSADDKRLLMQVALENEPSFTATVTERELEEFVNTREGFAYSMWMMCRDDADDLTPDEMTALIDKLKADEFDRQVLVRDYWDTLHTELESLDSDERIKRISHAFDELNKMDSEALRDWLLERNGKPTGDVQQSVHIE